MYTVPDITTLAERVRGPVFRPGTEGFAEETATWNTAIVNRPAIAVGVADAHDVVTAVRWAHEHGLPVAVQATGHGGVTVAGGALLINTRRLTELTIDPQARTARIGAGVKWAQVIEAASRHGLAPLNGSSSDVGAVGYSLGGGLGLMARRYGFAADHIRTVRMVTADGLLRTVDTEHDPELFWAVRGAGKGRFGVVTEIEIDLVPVTRLYGGGIFFPASSTADVLRAFAGWSTTLPEEMNTSLALLRLPDAPHVPEALRGRFVVHLRVAFVGDAADGERIIAPMRAAAPALIDTVADMPYTGVDAIHMDPVDPMPAYDAGVVLRHLPPEAVDALLAAAGPQVRIPLAVVELRLLGGAVGRPPAVPNAVSGREGAYSLLTIGPLAPGLEQVVPAVARTVLDAVAPFTASTALANFQGHAADPTEDFSGWSPAMRDRLALVAKTYDPTGMFVARR